MVSESNLALMTFAGFPPTIVKGGTSLEATLPAPITAPFPIVTHDKIKAP